VVQPSTSPRISILLPWLNARQFLEEQIDSILAQTFTDWEVIVLDSYSDDGSWEFFQVINNETSVTFPQFGNLAGDDPYGHGGISSARGFGGQLVPDSGSTVMLLGVALGSAEVLRRLILKKR